MVNQGLAKPIIVALSDEGNVKDSKKFAQPLRKQGIPAFNSMRQACLALNRFANYHEFIGASTQFETQ